MYHEHKNVI